MNPLNILINIFQRGQSLASQIREYQESAIGYEVLDRAPNGSYSVAVIIATEWESTIVNFAETQKSEHVVWGDWMYQIQAIATGYKSWVSADCLTLTGEHYSDLQKPFAHLETNNDNR